MQRYKIFLRFPNFSAKKRRIVCVLTLSACPQREPSESEEIGEVLSEMLVRCFANTSPCSIPVYIDVSAMLSE